MPLYPGQEEHMDYLIPKCRKFYEEVEFGHHSFIKSSYEQPAAMNGQDVEIMNKPMNRILQGLIKF